jgi:EpsI family protein
MNERQNDTSNTARVSQTRATISPWQLVTASLFVAVLGITPSFILIWPKWTETHTYSHGVLIVLLSAWLLWRQRDRINGTEVRLVPLAGLVLFGLLFGSALAFAANIEIGTEVLMPLTLICTVLFVAGVKIARIAAFPILLLYSAISVWDVINGTLQSWTTGAVTLILGVIQVPSYIEGNIVQIPSGVFKIAGGCSGLHFFVIGLTLAAIYGHMFLRTWLRKMQLIVVMGAMSIVMNWIRVATIITAGHLTEMQSYLVRVDHYTFGWVLFVVMLVPFFIIARRIEQHDSQGDERFRAAAPRRDNVGVSALLMLLAIIALPAFAWGRIMLHTGQPLNLVLPQIEGVEGPLPYSGPWEPVFPGVHGEALATYSVSGTDIDVYVNWFDGESQGQELIGYASDLAGKRLMAGSDRVHIDLTRTDQGNPLEFREIIARSNSGERRIIQYHYIIGGQVFLEPMKAKLWQAMRSILGRNGSGIMAWSMVCEADDNRCERARDSLKTEVTAIYAVIHNKISTLHTSELSLTESMEGGE